MLRAAKVDDGGAAKRKKVPVAVVVDGINSSIPSPAMFA
jgi:hypothetical protein